MPYSKKTIEKPKSYSKALMPSTGFQKKKYYTNSKTKQVQNSLYRKPIKKWKKSSITGKWELVQKPTFKKKIWQSTSQTSHKMTAEEQEWVDGTWEWDPITNETTHYSAKESKEREIEKAKKWKKEWEEYITGTK